MNLCDFWRIRTPHKKHYRFHQKQVSGFVQRRLDYFSVSSLLQGFIKKTNVFASFFTDLSPNFFSFEKVNDFVNGRGLWKSFISHRKYIESMKKHISEALCLLDNLLLTYELQDMNIWNMRFENSQKNMQKLQLKFE